MENKMTKMRTWIEVLAEIQKEVTLADEKVIDKPEQALVHAQMAIAKSLMAIYSVINQVLQIAKEQQ